MAALQTQGPGQCNAFFCQTAALKEVWNDLSHLISSMDGQCLRDEARPARSEHPIEVKLREKQWH